MSDREGYLQRRDQLLMQDEEIAELKAENAELRAAASPFAECLYLDEITSEERAALAVLLLQEKGGMKANDTRAKGMVFNQKAGEYIQELEAELAEAVRLLTKDADWFDLNDQEQRADELRDRVVALTGAER